MSMVQAEVFQTKSVREMLFEGYVDQFLAFANMAGAKASKPIDKFGWFYKVNSSFFVFILFYFVLF